MDPALEEHCHEIHVVAHRMKRNGNKKFRLSNNLANRIAEAVEQRSMTISLLRTLLHEAASSLENCKS